MSSEGSIGGSIDGTDVTSDLSGTIYALSIGRITIGGSIIAGTDTSTNGSLTRNGAIIAVKDLGTLAVKGNLIGNVTPNGVSRVLIAAVGQATPSDTVDLAIGKLSIGGRVEHAQILAGFDTSVSSTPLPATATPPSARSPSPATGAPAACPPEPRTRAPTVSAMPTTP